MWSSLITIATKLLIMLYSFTHDGFYAGDAKDPASNEGGTGEI